MPESDVLIKAYKEAFAGPHGVLVLADLSARCFEGKSTFVPGQSDVSVLNEGKRCVINHIRAMINTPI